MCNLYRLKTGTGEVAALFSVTDNAASANFPGEIYPGHPGLVIAAGALRGMTWGFPLAQKSKVTGKPLKLKPVNNTRADKLGSFFWRYSFAERRCLIPVEAFAEAEGPRGAKTRTWISRPEAKVFACAGIWRDTEEWGAAFSMVMTDASAEVEPVHDRMPVILAPEHYRTWVEAPPEEALELCQPYSGPLALERTDEPWVRR